MFKKTKSLKKLLHNQIESLQKFIKETEDKLKKDKSNGNQKTKRL